MLITTAIATLIALLFLAGTIFFGYKYLTIRKIVKEYQEIGTGRYGFYNFGGSSGYRAIVYVDELDRYTDGYSRIRINKIEPTSSISSYKKGSEEKAKNDFISLRLTSEIEWLESEDYIKKLRKEKLNKLNKV